ncbi:MAG: hypothetical protein F6K22_17130 [Okeania sp. SIO2F4]|nr:hypothetical protein [Okeania sp. SIO2F4]NES04403.1 hypothetical protein [Okeania sp. SIO2F4]
MTTHPHAGGASENATTVALEVIKEKFDYPSPRQVLHKMQRLLFLR